jgi:hypothetical protein
MTLSRLRRAMKGALVCRVAESNLCRDKENDGEPGLGIESSPSRYRNTKPCPVLHPQDHPPLLRVLDCASLSACVSGNPETAPATPTVTWASQGLFLRHHHHLSLLGTGISTLSNPARDQHPPADPISSRDGATSHLLRMVDCACSSRSGRASDLNRHPFSRFQVLRAIPESCIPHFAWDIPSPFSTATQSEGQFGTVAMPAAHQHHVVLWSDQVR